MFDSISQSKLKTVHFEQVARNFVQTDRQTDDPITINRRTFQAVGMKMAVFLDTKNSRFKVWSHFDFRDILISDISILIIDITIIIGCIIICLRHITYSKSRYHY